MISTLNYKRAYSEVDTFIDLLNEDKQEKIPKELRDFFKNEKDNSYNKIIEPCKPIKEQNLSIEALTIIAYLNLTYWCEDENEKQILLSIYDENEIKYQQELNQNFEAKKIFEKNTLPNQSNEQECSEPENMSLTEEKKESFFTKIINTIKSIFHK